MTEDQMEKLATATYHWLNFQGIAKGRNVLSERIMTLPILELLRKESGGHLRTEYQDSRLDKGGRGAPRRIDFAILSKEKKSLSCAIETKWVGKNSITKGLVHDILRLEHLDAKFRYLLIAGRQEDVGRNFIKAKLNNAGSNTFFSDQILPIDTEKKFKEIDLRKAIEPMQVLYASFFSTYNVELPSKFLVKIIANVTSEAGVQVLVWRIHRSRGARGTFNGPKEW